MNEDARPVWKMEDRGQRYSTLVELFRDGRRPDADDTFFLKVRCQGSGVFEIGSRHIRIDWQAGGTDSAHYFQTIGLALWLELKKVPCFHANALAYGDVAIALVAPSRTGKTTLSAALNQAGFALMTDDMLALHRSGKYYEVYPSWPVARMWPDTLDGLHELERSGSSRVHEKFEKRTVHIEDGKPGRSRSISFCSKPRVLSTIYLLNRIEADPLQKGRSDSPMGHCEIVPVTGTKAAMTLIQNSILGSCYGALGLEQDRLQFVADLLEQIKVRQVNYTSGKEYLREVCSALKGDVERDAIAVVRTPRTEARRGYAEQRNHS